MTPAPPGPFPPVNRRVVRAGTVLHRIHGRMFDADSFNPCLGRPTRFAPLRRPDGECISTAYAAESLECAVHETIFHEIQHDAPRKTIDINVVKALRYSTLSLTRDLTLGALFEPDLNQWGLTRRDLIDTFATQYTRTASWALAIHVAWPDIDGLVWTSRRCDPLLAFVLFGDRVETTCLKPLESQDITSDSPILGLIRECGRRAGITLVV